MRNPLLSMLIGFAYLTGLAVQAHAQGEKGKSDTPNVRPPQPGVVPFDAETAKQLQNAWAKYLSAAETLKNSIGMDLVLIPPGEFRMDPGGRMIVAEAFYLGKTEVTQAQWSAVMGTTPWKEKELKGDHRPATFVSWEDANAFCERLTAKERNGTYRLPAEAEWEYACRGGTTTRFSFGDDAALLEQFAWCSENSKKIGERYAHDVALKKPNPFGLFDMHGNVWEYCDGTYTQDPQKDERPYPINMGELRLSAGGSWDSDFSLDGRSTGSAFYCRTNSRNWSNIPTSGNNDWGFRVAWTPPGNKKPGGNAGR